ncbi:MAG: PLP-dependent aminotransferase family protein [Bacteroidales bacterium]|nr:PLP-dependent aminotransferase family protein [Bacteroidales bacterium]
MLLIDINTQRRESLYKQVFNQLKEMIDKNILKPGDKLPSSRRFSEQLGVNRTTIYKAYQELWSLGYIESRPGSYSVVRKRAEIVTIKDKIKKQIIDWEGACTMQINHLLDELNKFKNIKAEAGIINFLPLSPDPDLMPVNEFRKCLNRAIKEKGNLLFQYGDPMGYKPLRELIVENMKQHSISVSVDEILITNGAQNAVELILKMLVKPGAKVFVESPTYSSVIPLFNFYNVKVISVPLKESGIDLKVLEKKLHEEKPALIYTMPNFQNPTGITTSQTHRERFLRLCEKYRVPIVEDAFEEEMKYFGKNILPIKSMDWNDIVLYIGTFSKVLFPGLRLGWIAASKECIERLCALKRIGDLPGNTLNQAALYLFYRSGYYNMHIKRLHRIYRKRMNTALKAAREYFPSEKFKYTKPNGGYTFWVESLNKKINEDELINHIENYGVKVTPGRIFFPAGNNNSSFRISIAHLDEKQIEEGIIRIGKALKSL